MESSQTQNSSTSENQIQDVLEEELKKHYVKVLESGDEILITDLTINNKENADNLTFNIAQILWSGNYNKIEDSDPVDLIGEVFPAKRIYLLTEQDHFIKHYLSRIERFWIKKQNLIDEYASNRPEAHDSYKIAVNLDKAVAIGVHSHLVYLADEYGDQIRDEIIKWIFKDLEIDVDKLMVEDEKKYYLYFIPEKFIYKNKIIQSNILKKYVIKTEDEEKYGKRVRWYLFVEVDENFLDYMLDP